MIAKVSHSIIYQIWFYLAISFSLAKSSV